MLNAIVPSGSPPEKAPPPAVHPFVACPSCEGTLTWATDAVQCAGCAAAYPVYTIAGQPIPWLYSEPRPAWLGWQSRLRGFESITRGECEALDRSLDGELTPRARRRVETLLRAKIAYRSQIEGLLSSFELDSSSAADSPEPVLPRKQRLTGYIRTVFRDWSWDTDESSALFGALNQAIDGDLGSALIVGSGSGRLGFDLEDRCESTVYFDLNPLLTAVAASVIGGERVQLYEFPVAPRDGPQLLELTTPARLPPPQGRHFVIGDIMTPPFARESFNTVVTPWLIDILPHGFDELAQRMNSLLQPGGRWLNTGTLVFNHKNAALNLTAEETLDAVESQGFEVEYSGWAEIPYLCSPFSCHGRRERVFSFRARKLEPAAPVEPVEYAPAWARDPGLPVPSLSQVSWAASEHLMKAQILGAVDGNRSIESIAKAFAQLYDLSVPDAQRTVQKVLTELVD